METSIHQRDVWLITIRISATPRSASTKSIRLRVAAAGAGGSVTVSSPATSVVSPGRSRRVELVVQGDDERKGAGAYRSLGIAARRTAAILETEVTIDGGSGGSTAAAHVGPVPGRSSPPSPV